VREMPKINRNDTVTIQNVANGQTTRNEIKKSQSRNRYWSLVGCKIVTPFLLLFSGFEKQP
jgi:hypothetical protein